MNWKIMGGIGAVVVVLLLVLMIGGWVVLTYNGFVAKDQAVTAQWAQVETQYQRRIDLIPNLVNEVKLYTNYEGPLLTQLTALRSQWGAASNVNAKVDTANQIESTISKLLVVMENYPDLKANTLFVGLQDELAGTENRISVERMRFNEAVQSYNTSIKTMPNTFVAGMFGFTEKKYFQAAEGADIAPVVPTQ